MSLMDELAKEQKPIATCCSAGDWIANELDSDEQDAFAEWVGSGGAIDALYRSCSRRGLTCKRTTFTVHMRDHVSA